MKAKEICDFLISNAVIKHDPTCDGIFAGDPEKEVVKAATCFKATSKVIKEAADRGCGLLICHEGLWLRGGQDLPETDPDTLKRKLLDETGLVVFRYHDHAHESVPDFIHEGFFRKLGLKIAEQYPRESMGVCRYRLENETTVMDLAHLIAEKTEAKFPRICGKHDMKVRTVCLCLGHTNTDRVSRLMDPGCDLFIAGEADELSCCDYVNELAYYGNEKSMILFGHCGSEYPGMEYLAQWMTEKLIETEFIPAEGPYTGIFGDYKIM